MAIYQRGFPTPWGNGGSKPVFGKSFRILVFLSEAPPLVEAGLRRRALLAFSSWPHVQLIPPIMSSHS